MGVPQKPQEEGFHSHQPFPKHIPKNIFCKFIPFLLESKQLILYVKDNACQLTPIKYFI